MEHLPDLLSPHVYNSFAYITYKDRIPVTIVKVIDSLFRNKKNIADRYGEKSAESIKFITSQLSKLRHELSTNKPVELLDGNVLGDEDDWKLALRNEEARVRKLGLLDNEEDQALVWYKTSFLVGECYIYRRIMQAVFNSGLVNFDPFHYEKMESLRRGLQLFSSSTEYLIAVSKKIASLSKEEMQHYFQIFLKMALWGNEADLSLKVDDENAKLSGTSPDNMVSNFESYILIDDSIGVLDCLRSAAASTASTDGTGVKVIMILDNIGSELLSDLHLVEFLLTAQLATHVELMVKPMPWYVSDVTSEDVETTLNMMSDGSSSSSSRNNNNNKWLADQIRLRMQHGSMTVATHAFFSSPHSYANMHSVAPDLYSHLSSANLLIFKGDLNYRKLVGDRKWSVCDTTFKTALLGFEPTNLVSLRVLKCDVQVGLNEDKLNWAQQQVPGEDKWLVTSRFGVVQALLI